MLIDQVEGLARMFWPPIQGTSESGSLRPVARFAGLGDSDWAVIYGEDRYRLHGDPAGRFWWTAGLCRFEAGEIDGYGVERV